MMGKGIEFTGEDEFDLTFKSYNELVDAFTVQDALPREVWMEAIENTNRMADSVTDFTLSTKARYPILTGTSESDAKVYIKRTHDMLNDKICRGIIPEYEATQFKADVEEELTVFKKTNMLGFMLSMSDLMIWGKNEGIPFDQVVVLLQVPGVHSLQTLSMLTRLAGIWCSRAFVMKTVLRLVILISMCRMLIVP